MPKLKTSVTIDEDKIAEVRRITGAESTSAAIDAALDEVIQWARVRHDVLAYRQTRPDQEEIALAQIAHDWSDLADDTDWATLYEEDSSE